MKKKYSILYLIILGFLFTGCKEEINIESIAAFEKLLVVEATITNEFKHQEVNIFSTFNFEEDNPDGINNANVKIIDDAQNTYNFIEDDSDGKYISEIEFSAQENKTYQLFITTDDGGNYTSQTTKLTGVTQIDDLYASRESDNLGNETMTIFIDSYDSTGNSKYYRYKYEETYKIIAPFWSPLDFDIISREDPFVVSTKAKTKEEHTCYNTVLSNMIIQTATTNLNKDRVTKFPVRIISRENPIISHRYSILIRQYVQSFDAYTYYNILNKLSGSENIFSQNQQGFFSGNIYSIDNPKEKVIGFFDVSSVSSKRIFFNYKDFFPNEPLPPYFIDCILTKPELTQPGSSPPWSQLITWIDVGHIKFYEENNGPPPPVDPDSAGTPENGPYIAVTWGCGDCTKFGSNIKPSFWEE